MRPITIPDDASTDKSAKQALMRRQLSYVDQARTILGRGRGENCLCHHTQIKWTVCRNLVKL